MSASTVPPKKLSWLDAEEAGKTNNLFLVLLLKGQREALSLLRKRTVSARVRRLSRALAKRCSSAEAYVL